MAEKTKIQLDFNIPVKLFKEGQSYVAYTPVLDLSSCGKTEKKALQNISEAAQLFIKECIKDGTLEEVLQSLGWKKEKSSNAWKPPKVVDLEVPIAVSV